VFLSLCYVVLRRVLQLAALRFRSNDLKELEIVVLRHELAIVRRRIRCPAMTSTDRLFLAAASRLLPSARWRSFIIAPLLSRSVWGLHESGRPLRGNARHDRLADAHTGSGRTGQARGPVARLERAVSPPIHITV